MKDQKVLTMHIYFLIHLMIILKKGVNNSDHVYLAVFHSTTF